MNIKIEDFPNYLKDYKWKDKHSLFGYPPDVFNSKRPNDSFEWIQSLERRFAWILKNSCSGRYLVPEMIQWGGSQNGVLQKFDDAITTVCLDDKIKNVICNLGDPRNALNSALEIPGLGLTYASKLLRFLDPARYGALDSRLRKALEDKIEIEYSQKQVETLNGLQTYNYSNPAPCYIEFLKLLGILCGYLNKYKISNPCTGSSEWSYAHIEMALFSLAATHGKSTPLK